MRPVIKCVFSELTATTVGFSESVYSVVEGEGSLEVRVVLELPEPLPNQTVEIVVLAQDTTATCKAL